MNIDFADESTNVDSLTELINRVYADGERGLWIDGAARTDAVEVAAIIRSRELVVARVDGVVVGAVRLQVLSDEVGEFGMLVADPDRRGIGIGRDLVAYAEQWAQEQGLAQMQLELLVPRTWSHPVKEFLRGWYTRIGYQQVRTAQLEEAYPALQPLLATPCDFLIFRKKL
jgi:GNAT superfamily N-acetyltransferase